MTIAGICISFIVALLGIAFPLMLQVIARVEDKYKSNVIIGLLRDEISWKIYRVSLFSSLFVVLLYIVRNYPLLQLNNELPAFITHIIVIALVIGTTVAVISFIVFIDRLLVYDSMSRLTKYLIKNDRDIQKDEEHIYFTAITDVLVGSVRDLNIPLVKTISDYCYEVYQQYRDSFKDEPVEYPNQYYDLIYRSIEELAISKEKGIPFLEVRTIGGIWLFGEAKGYRLHEVTYRWLWRNLLLAIKHERDDFLMHYWERADQRITYNLSPILNEEHTDELKDERLRFLEFHFALGGLLMYRERYNIVGRFFRFTRSQPPQRELLPKEMNEIFNLYFEFRDPYDRDYLRIQSRYYFPDIEGIHSDDIIKNWISKYLALLFIRQYSIVPHLIYMKPLEQPILPENQQDKKMWIDNLGHFKTLVESIYNNASLLSSCKLDYVTDEWCKENGKPTPLEFVDTLILNVNEAYEREKIEQQVSETKRLNFIEYSKNRIKSIMEIYEPIKNSGKIEKDHKDWFINGGNAVIDKSSFAENQDVDSLNYHSFLADSLSDKYQDGISEVFFNHATKRYLIKQDHLEHALGNLKLDGNKHFIVGFGINDNYMKELLPSYNLDEKNTNGITTYIYPKCNYTLVKETLFIISKDDLPEINHLELEQKQIDEYNLELVNEEFKIYISLIDLFRNDELRTEIASSRQEDNLEQSVLLQISMITQLRWKKEMKMVALRLFSQFAERGLPIEPKEIKPF